MVSNLLHRGNRNSKWVISTTTPAVHVTKNVRLAYGLEVLDTKAHYFGAIASLARFTPRKCS